MIDLLTIPSPADGVWSLGPIPIRGYALCIIAGIVAAVWIGERRWQARGGTYGDVQDVAIWGVPFGIVGARLYHVFTDYARFFDSDSPDYAGPKEILYIWHGGLGIWGGVALGALGAYIGCRVKGIKFLPMLDALAPGVLVAQAIGRWGNWFNQELYGRPTDLPWGLEISQDNFSSAYRDQLAAEGTPLPDTATFHPTFLYECIWNLAAFAFIIWAARRWSLGHGRTMALYVMAYTLGRGWIEYIRIDDVQLNDVLGLRFNVWTSIVLFVAAALFFLWSAKKHPGMEADVYRTKVEEVAQRPARDQDPATDEADAAEVTAEVSTDD